MNYVGHIQLAQHSSTSKLGNFLGDFVKGSDLSSFSAQIQQGIELHRAIDSFADNHPVTVNLRQRFPSEVRRMAGVIIDVYFDHLLCKHWQNYSSESQNKVLDGFYTELESTKLSVSTRFKRVKQGLIEYRWLAEYIEVDAVIRAYRSIEQRINSKITFADRAADLIIKRETELQSAFAQLYPELQAFVVQKTTNT